MCGFTIPLSSVAVMFHYGIHALEKSSTKGNLANRRTPLPLASVAKDQLRNMERNGKLMETDWKDRCDHTWLTGVIA